MIVVRTINCGRVKIGGRWFHPRVPCDLDGRFAFGTYYDCDFVSLWGTERMYRAIHDDEEYDAAYTEFCRLTGDPIHGFPDIPSGTYSMDRQGEEFIAYRSKGYDWWDAEASA